MRAESGEGEATISSVGREGPPADVGSQNKAELSLRLVTKSGKRALTPYLDNLARI